MADVEENLEDAVAYLVKAVVSHPDEVKTEYRAAEGDGQDVVWVHVHSDDMGRVIGRRGRTIRGFRSILSLAEHSLGRAAGIDLDE